MRGVSPCDAANLQGRLWTPNALRGSGLAGWWDASDFATISCDGSGNVSNWQDKSGSVNNLAQGTAADRPPFSIGFPASRMPALNPAATDNFPLGTNIAYNAANGISAMCVGENSSTNAPKAFFGFGSGGGGPELRWNGSPNTLSLLRNSAANLATSAATAASGSIHVAGMGAQTNYSAVFLDGVETSNATDPAFSQPISNLFTSFGSEDYRGFAGEIIISTFLWSLRVRQQVEGYLAWKWDGGRAGLLVGQLPASHPYKNAPPALSGLRVRQPRLTMIGGAPPAGGGHQHVFPVSFKVSRRVAYPIGTQP